MSSRKLNLSGIATAAAAATTTTPTAVTSLEKHDNATTEKKSIIEIVKTSTTDTTKTVEDAAATPPPTTATTKGPTGSATKVAAAAAAAATTTTTNKSLMETAKTCVTLTIKTLMAKTLENDKKLNETAEVDTKASSVECKKSTGDSKKSNGDTRKSTEEATTTAEDAVKQPGGDSDGDAAKSAEDSAGKSGASTRTSSLEDAPASEEDSPKDTPMKEPAGKSLTTTTTTTTTPMESKRITRNSPLPLTSPTTANKKELSGDAVDAAIHNESDEANATNAVTTKRTVQIRGRKSIKEMAAAKEAAALKEKEAADEDAKAECKASDTDEIEHKDAKIVECSTPALIREEPVAVAVAEQQTTTRQTRKYVAKEPIPNTRVTRNRQSSTGSSSQPAPVAVPQTTAAKTEALLHTVNSGRGRKPGWTKKAAAAAAAAEAAVKRKRSTDEEKPSEPGAKYIKIDTSKEDSEAGDEDAMSSTTETAAGLDDVKIKQELIESDESSSATDISGVTNVTGTPPAAAATAGARGRGRYKSRRNPANRPAFSPSTRSTRQSKAATSPSPTPPPTGGSGGASEAKRRRTGTPIANTRSTSALSLLKSATAGSQGQQPPDEDSKDSMASSMDDLLGMTEVKVEKLITAESEETLDFDMADKTEATTTTTATATATAKSDAAELVTKSSNGIAQALTVDTGAVAVAKAMNDDGVVVEEDEEEAPLTPVASTSADAVLNGGDSGSEKAASLSPEMVSEGVSEISVKQFYKTPKFRENNLGIEEDPKLGEIVQKVGATSDEAPPPTTANTTPRDSPLEGAAAEGVESNAVVNDDDCHSNASIKEGELRLDESGDERKSPADGGDSVAAALLVDELEEERNAVAEEAEEDDVTVEESENVSMDNNASVNEDEPNEELPELASHKLQEKTKSTECDMLLQEAELKADEAVATEADVAEAAKVSAHDDVLAKINAELQKIGEKLNEKPLKVQEGPKDAVEVDVAAEAKSSGANKENARSVEATLTDAIVVKSLEGHEDDKKEVDVEMHVDVEDIVEEQAEEHSDEKEDLADEKHLFEPLKRSPSPTERSLDNLNISPFKPKDDDVASVKSNQSNTSWVTLDLEHDEESLRQKEQHLQTLGLLTHKAAEQRRQEFIQTQQQQQQHQQQQHQQQQQPQPQHHYQTKRKGGSAAGSSSTHSTQEYTGTLKTVIKLNRNSHGAASTSAAAAAIGGGHTRHKAQLHRDAGNNNNNNNHHNNSGGANRRQSLKMTFQKGRGRGQGQGNDRHASDQNAPAEDSYYTIQNENEDSSHSDVHDVAHATAAVPHASKKDEKEEILIPEKASSFKFHPGRLCEDQCFYCSGKFGLYDTPCHVGQIKSVERQQKILANEEKLTVDNCLCDACFRHVDRRANVPSYKKRLSAPGSLEHAAASGAAADLAGKCNEADDGDGHAPRKCIVPDCADAGVHSLRRKCIRKSVKKFLLNFELPPGSPCVWLCKSHYATVIQCSGCVLCKRRLGKNHMYHITSDTDRLEKALTDMGIPVQLGIGTAVCKLCRYFANLLMKPLESARSQKAEFVRNYKKRLLQFHNIHEGSNDASEADDEDTNGPSTSQKSLACGANKQDDGSSSKEMPSPGGSSGSSVECLGMADAASATAEQQQRRRRQQQQQQQQQHQQQHQQQQQQQAENDTTDYEGPLMSSDSNSSSSPPLPAADGVAGAGGGSGGGDDDDVPMSKLKAILQSNNKGNSSGSGGGAGDTTADISNALRANPNISMRELFPGEEDLGLNFRAPFGSNASQRTPEGWTRVQTFLQYDEPTRRLWEELQKPYGNQSSFLRHLILLEKYYRNGDLILSPNASSNASVYTQTVRQRLVSYDQGHCGGLKETTATAQAKDPIPTVEINEDDDEETRRDADDSMDTEGRGAARVAAASLTPETTITRSVSMELRSRSVSVDKLTKQLSTSAVTITARPKDNSATSTAKQQQLQQQQPSLAASPQQQQQQQQQAQSLLKDKDGAAHFGGSAAHSRSILKTNLLGMNKSVEILPVSASANSNRQPTSSPSPNASTGGVATATAAESKQQKILDVANKLLGSQLEAAAAAAAAASSTSGAAAAATLKFPNASLLTSPPELVSFQRRATGAVPSANATGNAATAGLSMQNANNNNNNSSSSSNINNNNKRMPMPAKVAPNRAAGGNARPPPNVVVLADTLTPQERQQSKSWRPTLMPVEENQHLLTKGGPLYQTVDKRRLPAVVQVQSGGKPFLISIFDYNRMCILRREKLMRDQMLKAKKQSESANKQGQQQQQQQQAHTQHDQQKSSIPLNLAGGSSSNFNKNSALTAKQQQQQAAQRQLFQLQMMQLQKQHNQQFQQQAQMKSSTTTGGNSSAATAIRYQPIAPKPAQQQQQQQQQSSGSASSNATNAFDMMPPLANALNNFGNSATLTRAALINATPSTSWLWNHFPDANQMISNGGAQGVPMPKLPQLLHKSGGGGATASGASLKQQQQQQQQQLLLDNTLMSKIPKSLTVIPQHKLMNNSTNGSVGGSGNSAGHKE